MGAVHLAPLHGEHKSMLDDFVDWKSLQPVDSGMQRCALVLVTHLCVHAELHLGVWH